MERPDFQTAHIKWKCDPCHVACTDRGGTRTKESGAVYLVSGYKLVMF